RERGGDVRVLDVEARRVRGLGAPARLGLDDRARERDLAQHAPDRAPLVTPAQVRDCVDGVVRRVESARAVQSRDLVKRALRSTARCACNLAGLPDALVDDGPETQSCRRLRDRPGAPAEHAWRLQLADCCSGLHHLIPANRTAAGGMTLSMRPYPTAS